MYLLYLDPNNIPVVGELKRYALYQLNDIKKLMKNTKDENIYERALEQSLEKLEKYKNKLEKKEKEVKNIMEKTKKEIAAEKKLEEETNEKIKDLNIRLNALNKGGKRKTSKRRQNKSQKRKNKRKSHKN